MSASPFCTEKSIWTGSATVTENLCVAEETYRLTLQVAGTMPLIRSGQFVMLRLPHRADPLLGRPLAIYRVEDHSDGFLLEVVYIVVGKMTARLAQVRTGESLDLWAPLGNGFPRFETEHAIMVAGGIGQTPFFMLADELTDCRRTLLYGARSKDRMACVDDFERILVDVHPATDDGSAGHHGLVTDLIEKVYRPGESTQILCCGPHPMLQAAFRVAQKLGLPCLVSLETPMGCGLGICFGCVISYRTRPEDAEWDYRRTCIDGPVFDAYRLCWDD